jgi:hypothetical protein
MPAPTSGPNTAAIEGREDGSQEPEAGFNAWNRASPGFSRFDCASPSPAGGRCSFMDLGGTFHDFGLRAVRHATGAEPRDRVSGKRIGGVSAEPAGSERASVWLAVALGVLAAAAGFALAGRTKRGKGA